MLTSIKHQLSTMKYLGRRAHFARYFSMLSMLHVYKRSLKIEYGRFMLVPYCVFAPLVCISPWNFDATIPKRPGEFKRQKQVHSKFRCVILTHFMLIPTVCFRHIKKQVVVQRVGTLINVLFFNMCYNNILKCVLIQHIGEVCSCPTKQHMC